MYRLYISEKAKPLMPPALASRTVNGDPIAPVNPPGSHPIAAPITVVINGPMVLTTMLSGDGSAIVPPSARDCRVGDAYIRTCAFATGPQPSPLRRVNQGTHGQWSGRRQSPRCAHGTAAEADPLPT